MTKETMKMALNKYRQDALTLGYNAVEANAIAQYVVFVMGGE